MYLIYMIGWRSNGIGELFQIHRINPFLFFFLMSVFIQALRIIVYAFEFFTIRDEIDNFGWLRFIIMEFAATLQIRRS